MSLAAGAWRSSAPLAPARRACCAGSARRLRPPPARSETTGRGRGPCRAERLFDGCGRLSGGELQRVGVARVLYQMPELILADEPVSALDPKLSHQTVGELNRDAMSRGVTLVASLHSVDLALKWFPRIVGLNDGVVAFDAPPVRVSDAMLRELYQAETEV